MLGAKKQSGSVVNANFRMCIERIVSDFLSDDKTNEYEFPESFIPAEILFVRKYVDQFDLKTALRTKSKDLSITCVNN